LAGENLTFLGKVGKIFRGSEIFWKEVNLK